MVTLLSESPLPDILPLVTISLGRLLIGVLAVLFAISAASDAYAQESTAQSGVSTQLSSYLSLTTQQRESIVKLSRQPNAKTESRQQLAKVHGQIVASLTADQREKLKLLESSEGHGDLKAEARSLHLLCPQAGRHGFGGATTKYRTSTCVEPGTNQNSPPANPPQ